MERRDLVRRLVCSGMLAIAGGFILMGAQILGPNPALSASPATPVHLRLLDWSAPLDWSSLKVSA